VKKKYSLGDKIYCSATGRTPTSYEVVKIREIDFKSHTDTYIYGINLDNGLGIRFYVGEKVENFITHDSQVAWRNIWLRQSNEAKESKDFYFNTILKGSK
jgi:hypothetical protein